MSCDLYVDLGGSTQQDVKEIVEGTYRGVKVHDVATRVRLLTGTAASDANIKDYAVSGDRKRGGGYKQLVQASNPATAPFTTGLIQEQLKRLNDLGLLKPSFSLLSLPTGSWLLQFEFTLAKSWMSKDDTPFYVSDRVNPVRKDKVFKVPVMSAASWKGLLRWTAMHVRLALNRDQLKTEDFARERVRQALLFGDEKGEEPGQPKDFAAYLDGLNGDAGLIYRRLVKEHFGLSADAQEMPHHSGRLNFYPTFFDLIDVEVINPHSRKTKAGTNPIYLECVPASAKGTFSLLYVPFDLVGESENEVKTQAQEDLGLVAEGVSAMMLTYGFSAKRTSGFGTAQDGTESAKVWTRANDRGWPLTRLSTLSDGMKNVQF
ncbi:MAG: CRISPR-associated protein [Acidobacteria bacterium]|nr:CRISPR-associated protein [Acidobacteriota bacterium]